MSTVNPDTQSISLYYGNGKPNGNAAVELLRMSFSAAMDESLRKQSETTKGANGGNDSSENVAADSGFSDREGASDKITQRKNLDRAEIAAANERHREIDREYRHRTNRFETDPGNAFQGRQISTIPEIHLPELITLREILEPSISADVFQADGISIGPLTPGVPSIITVPSTLSSSLFSVSATNQEEFSGTGGNVVFAPQISTPTISQQVSSASVEELSAFTIFTASGRFGNVKRESGEKSEGKKERAATIFGSFVFPGEAASVDASEDVEAESVPGRHSPENLSKQEQRPRVSQGGNSLKELLESGAFVKASEVVDPEMLRKFTERMEIPGSEIDDRLDRDRFIRRVAAAVQSQGPLNGIVRIRLHPESLGTLMIRIGMKKGKISVHFETENADAKQLLLESVQDLKQHLASQEIELADCRIS